MKSRNIVLVTVVLLGGFNGYTIPSYGQNRINPSTDMQYLGAFKVPNNSVQWSYGQRGMGFNINGDPKSENDGYPGSLFVVGHDYSGNVTEISIPSPVNSPTKNLADLPRATTLQPFTDVTDGRVHWTDNTGQDYLGDIEVVRAKGTQTSDKLYWVRYQYYVPPANTTTLGWSELDFANLHSSGVWRIGNTEKDVTGTTSKYLFQVPSTWAESNSPGKTLAAGRQRVQATYGPGLHVLEPFSSDTPPADGTEIPTTRLLSYTSANPVKNFSHSDTWNDGAWLEVGNNSAVIFAGTAGVRDAQLEMGGTEYYGDPGPDGCRAKGYQAEPYYGAILFYDTDELAKVARGEKSPLEIQPYAELQVENYMFIRSHCKFSKLGGVGYDRKNNLLYIIELEVEGVYDKIPIVHVWKIFESGIVADTQPPTQPKNVKIISQNASEATVTWDASTDNNNGIMYIIYRNGKPCTITTNTTFIDKKISSFPPPYVYSVEARDAVNNSSMLSSIKSYPVIMNIELQ